MKTAKKTKKAKSSKITKKTSVKESAITCHKEQVAGLKRAEGQVRGVISMVEREEYCIDIIRQVRAAKSALATIESKMLSKHIKNCLREAFSTKNENKIDKKVDEIVALALKLKG